MCADRRIEIERSFAAAELCLVQTAVADRAPYIRFDLYPYGTEAYDGFPDIARQVSRRLLAAFEVLTSVHEFPLGVAVKRKDDQASMSFLNIYYLVLRAHEMTGGTYFRAPYGIITRTKGANGPLLSLIYPGDRGVFGCTMWGFSSVPEFTDYTQAGEWAATQLWAIRLDYSRYPDTLEVQMDPKQLSADQCISCIREICDHEGIKLLETFVPPEGSDTNGAHA